MKNMIAAAMMALAIGVTACSGLNNATEKHLGITMVDPYENTSGFVEKAYVTTRLYEATLDAAIFACDVEVNPKAVETPDEVCASVAKAVTKLSPNVEKASRAIGTYVYLNGKVDQAAAAGQPVPDAILSAAAKASYEARSAWDDVEYEIQDFNASAQ